MENEEKTQEIQGQSKEPNQKKKIMIIAVCIIAVLLGIFAVVQGVNRDAAGTPDLVETTTTTQTTTTKKTTAETTVSQTTTETTITEETTVSETTAESTVTTLAATATPTASATVKPSATPKATPKPGEPIPGNYVLVVYKGTQVVVAYEADSKGNYDPNKAYRKMICSTGSSSGLTPNGTFKIYNKYTYRALQGAYGQYCSRFNGGILFHSVPISTSAPTVEQGRSMMNTASYNKLGSPASHGCVRMLVRDAKWIYNNCKMGTKVIVTDSSSPVGGAGKPALKRYPPYTNAVGDFGWDPTDPHPSNPYNNPDIVVVESVTVSPTAKTLKVGESVQLTAKVKPTNAYETAVTWSSSNTAVATVSASGKVTALKAGEAVITVKTKDGGKTATCTITVQEETTPTETTTSSTTQTTPTATTPSSTTQTTVTTPSQTTVTTPTETTTTTTTSAETTPTEATEPGIGSEEE